MCDFWNFPDYRYFTETWMIFFGRTMKIWDIFRYYLLFKIDVFKGCLFSIIILQVSFNNKPLMRHFA